MKTTDLVKTATKFIELHTDQSYQESKIEAEEIFMRVLGMNKPKMYSNLSISMTEEQEKKIYYILNKRKNDVPLSYILKDHLFYRHNFYVDEGVLIPRSETESIIDQILVIGDELYEEKNRCNFLDAGCGSGCVGITIAIERPKWNVVLSDISMEAIMISKKNTQLLNQNNIKLVCGDWLKPFRANSFDFIFSNPPYISTSDRRVDKSVLHNEPPSAIFSGIDGLDDIKEIIKSSKKILSDRGMLFMENGINQTKKISDLLESNEFTDISIHMDYNNHNRFTSSRKK